MKFIHFTDPHLMPRGECLHGLNPVEPSRRASTTIRRHHGDAELCVVTGDLAHHAQPRPTTTCANVCRNCECRSTSSPGNHDRRDRLLAAFPETPVDADGFLQAAVRPARDGS